MNCSFETVLYLEVVRETTLLIYIYLFIYLKRANLVLVYVPPIKF